MAHGLVFAQHRDPVVIGHVVDSGAVLQRRRPWNINRTTEMMAVVSAGSYLQVGILGTSGRRGGFVRIVRLPARRQQQQHNDWSDCQYARSHLGSSYLRCAGNLSHGTASDGIGKDADSWPDRLWWGLSVSVGS